MNDTWTVYRKELRETFGDRHSLHGAMAQAVICILLTGVIVPLMERTVWASISTTLTLYVIFPATFAATLSADAFAGERERKTLETLLATPLTTRSVFLGKVAMAVTFVVAVSGASLATGAISSATRGMLTISPAFVLETLTSAFAGAFLVSAIAIAISSAVAVARSAQQIGSLTTFALAGIVVAALKMLSIPLTWSTVLGVDAVVFIVGAVGLLIAMTSFSRDRVFENSN